MSDSFSFVEYLNCLVRVRVAEYWPLEHKRTQSALLHCWGFWQSTWPREGFQIPNHLPKPNKPICQLCKHLPISITASARMARIFQTHAEWSVLFLLIVAKPNRLEVLATWSRESDNTDHDQAHAERIVPWPRAKGSCLSSLLSFVNILVSTSEAPMSVERLFAACLKFFMLNHGGNCLGLKKVTEL